MAANILAHCGWEAGAILDSSITGNEIRASFQLASLWTLNIGTYGSTIQDIEAGGIVRSGGGRYALAMRPAGLCGPNGCRSTAFIARATAANTKVWWGGWVRIGYPDNWPNTKVDDQYLLLACTQTAGTAASKHLGIGLILTAGSIWGIQINVVAAAKTYTRTDIGGNFITQGIRAGDTVTFSGFSNAGNNGVKVVDTVTATVITVTSGTGLVNETGDGNEAVTGPVRFKFEAYRLTTTSAIDGAALVPGSSFSADFFADTWYWVQLEVDITTRACKLYVWDGASEVSGTGTDDAGTDYPSYFVPRYFFGGGKGSDAAWHLYFDDWSSADTANSGTRPDSTYVEILHQPNADIAGESDFTGVGDTTNKHRNWDDENDEAPSTDDENTPTGVGDTQVSSIIDKNAAGSVEAVTLVFAADVPTVFEYTGVFDDAGGTTLTDAGASWPVDGLIGFVVLITAGTGVGSSRVITDNTATTLTVASLTTSASSVYLISVSHFLRARTGGSYQEYGSVGTGYRAITTKAWYGKPFNKTPDATPATWTNTLFDLLEAGVTAIDTEPVGEFYALAFGPSLVRPPKTLAIVGSSLLVAQAVNMAGTY